MLSPFAAGPSRARCLARLAALIGLAWAGPAAAVDDVLPPRAMGMGGAVRASATGALGPLFNPAGMTTVRQYDLEAMYGFRVQDLGSTIHLAIVDSVTSRVSAGVYYTFIHGNPKLVLDVPGRPTEALREGHETGLSLAMNLGQWFAFGMTAKYTRMQTEVANPNAPKMNAEPSTEPKSFILDTSTSTAIANGFTMDAGALFNIGQSFRIGVTGHNLIPLRSTEAPIGVGIGLSYQYGSVFLISADAKIDFDKYRERGKRGEQGEWIPGPNKIGGRVGVGLEYLIAGAVPIRAGFAYDTAMPGSFLSLGAGYVSARFGVDLGYRQKVGGGLESSLILGLRVFLQ